MGWSDGIDMMAQSSNEMRVVLFFFFFLSCNCRRKVTCNVEGLICRHLQALSLPYRWKWKRKAAVTKS